MKIILIAANPDIAELFYEYRQDPETKKYNPLAVADIEALRTRLSNSSSDLSEIEKAETFFWFVQSEGKICGNVTISNINRMMQTACPISSKVHADNEKTAKSKLLILIPKDLIVLAYRTIHSTH